MGRHSFQILYQFFLGTDTLRASVQYCCRFHSQYKYYIKRNKRNLNLSFGFSFNPGIQRMNHWMIIWWNHELWESLYSYINSIFSLPAPLLYCVFDRFLLLHKIPNNCCFYPYFSMLFRFSICQLFVLLTVRPWNQNTTDTFAARLYNSGSAVLPLGVQITDRSKTEKARRNMDKNGNYWGCYGAERSDLVFFIRVM